MKDILIMGAGPAGMATAMELYRAGKKFIVVEKDARVGGLSQTYSFGAFRTDNGPHRFFSKNRYLYDFIKDLLKEDWIVVNRLTRFFIGGKFYRYPVEWKDTLTTMGPLKAIQILLDYAIARILYRGKDPKNFEEYAISNFGRSLAEFNVLNYTEKIWGIPCSELSVDWASQRIQDLSIWGLIKKVLFGKGGARTLVDQFYYPAHGTGLIYEKIREKVENGNEFVFNTGPQRLVHGSGIIRAVHLENGKTIEPSMVVSSIPVTSLLEALDPAPPREVMGAASKLRYRSQVYLFLTLNKPSVSKDQWIYFPDRDIPFGRISEMKNFSDCMSPPGETSLFIEFFCWEGDATWNASKEELLELAVPWLQKLEFLKKEEIVDSFHLKRKNVYPLYDLAYQTHLSVVKNYLDSFSNLIYIGRPGRFRYTNQDHSLEMGILAAQTCVGGKRYDLDAVGAGKEYFEKGYVVS